MREGVGRSYLIQSNPMFASFVWFVVRFGHLSVPDLVCVYATLSDAIAKRK